MNIDMIYKTCIYQKRYIKCINIRVSIIEKRNEESQEKEIKWRISWQS